MASMNFAPSEISTETTSIIIRSFARPALFFGILPRQQVGPTGNVITQSDVAEKDMKRN